jgi:hypothetical protein
MLFKNSVHTSKRTSHFTITKTKWLRLFKEIIAVYAENHAKSINTQNAMSLIANVSGTYCYHSALRG